MKITAKEITKELLDRLWNRYLKRVSYANKYVELVTQKGGRIVNDHIALRTLNTHTGEQPEGIRAIKHILNCLEYSPVAKYKFPKKRLNATHFEHPDESFPKIFVSQLEVNQLPNWAQDVINKTVNDTQYLLSDSAIELLMLLKEEESLTEEAAGLLVTELVQYFKRPWKVPFKEDVLKLNDVSQYAAWVLLHGNSINHFTAFINFQEVEEWPDLKTTCKGLEAAGVPMKENIEGEKGSKLRQSATQAVKEEVEVRVDDGIEKINWTYAYYELAQRDFVEENGQVKLFTGFLGEQAAHLFDMTTTREN
ncbi:MAG: DUF1338 domain-containing protein [Prolixibacteraceae bacterium]|jgi:hypothetical protein|nr:DUF1338 domain-containing protein [Prolixibacteraceae bacterium]MBT6005752.1 DUF1338 domain-containing protein [Prolixibacteraceae bacterium]MBT6998140.1 DUF1338 domain-containing protein [Prolixibacteraceae bacterium]MBT7395682.1 DUF1338 domain-containing protein [Prolixibacteraceae bacterium]